MRGGGGWTLPWCAWTGVACLCRTDVRGVVGCQTCGFAASWVQACSGIARASRSQASRSMKGHQHVCTPCTACRGIGPEADQQYPQNRCQRLAPRQPAHKRLLCRALDPGSREQQRVLVLERLVARLQAQALVRHADSPTPMEASPSSHPQVGGLQAAVRYSHGAVWRVVHWHTLALSIMRQWVWFCMCPVPKGSCSKPSSPQVCQLVG